MKNIIIIQKELTHYRLPIFNFLNESIPIILLTNKLDNQIIQPPVYVKQIKAIKYGTKSTAIYLRTLGQIIKLKPKIIIHEFTPSILSLPVLILYCKLSKRIKLVLWGHGFNQNKKFNPKTKFSSMLRILFIKLSDALIVYGDNAKNILIRYVNPKKVFVAHNTLDTELLGKIKFEFDDRGIQYYRKKLGFVAKYNLIFIGRLIPSKMPLFLIDIMNILRRTFKNNIHLHMIGTGSLEKKIKDNIEKNKLSEIITLYGAIYDIKLTSAFLYASNLVLIPGHLGLAINHAFCFDLPVFSFFEGPNGPSHAPEAEYIINGKTGFFAQPFNVNELSNLISNYLLDENIQNMVISNIRQILKNRMSIDNMIKGFKNCINYLQSDTT